jgi:hypothetical protein
MELPCVELGAGGGGDLIKLSYTHTAILAAWRAPSLRRLSLANAPQR